MTSNSEPSFSSSLFLLPPSLSSSPSSQSSQSCHHIFPQAHHQSVSRSHRQLFRLHPLLYRRSCLELQATVSLPPSQLAFRPIRPHSSLQWRSLRVKVASRNFLSLCSPPSVTIPRLDLPCFFAVRSEGMAPLSVAPWPLLMCLRPEAQSI